MTLVPLFKAFKTDESGAVTVDWVVLTAAIVSLCLIVMLALQDPLLAALDAIVGFLQAATAF
jgi:Flp pilus assembly pilin Flp